MGWEGVRYLRWTSANNNRWTRWLFIVLWSDVSQRRWPGVYTGHSHTASRQGEGHEEHLKESCKGLRSQTHTSEHTQSESRTAFLSQCDRWITFAELKPSCPWRASLKTVTVFARAHPELLREDEVMEISSVIIPGDCMLMHSRLFVWENCIVVISVTPELRDATWQTSSSALRCPPRIYIFITTREGNQNDITARAQDQTHNLKDLIECIQMWFIEQLHSHSTGTQCNCFAYTGLSSPFLILLLTPLLPLN